MRMGERDELIWFNEMMVDKLVSSNSTYGMKFSVPHFLDLFLVK